MSFALRDLPIDMFRLVCLCTIYFSKADFGVDFTSLGGPDLNWWHFVQSQEVDLRDPPQSSLARGLHRLQRQSDHNCSHAYDAHLGSSQTRLFQAWLLATYTWKRSFELFCALAFTLFCAPLRSFACFCVRPRLERPHLPWELQTISSGQPTADGLKES